MVISKRNRKIPSHNSEENFTDRVQVYVWRWSRYSLALVRTTTGVITRLSLCDKIRVDWVSAHTICLVYPVIWGNCFTRCNFKSVWPRASSNFVQISNATSPAVLLPHLPCPAITAALKATRFYRTQLPFHCTRLPLCEWVTFSFHRLIIQWTFRLSVIWNKQ